MKQVIFICLLSISMCLSDTAAPVANSSAPIPPAVHDKIETKNNTTQTAPINPPTVDKDNKTVPAANTTIPNNKNETVPQTGTVQPTNNTQPTPQIPTDKTVPPTVTPPTHAPIVPPTQGNSTTNGTVPADHKTPPAPTPAPHKIEPTVPAVQARGFDGASFVGGIILTLGLLAIGFMGFKYYKNQTERNYHTL